MIDLKTVWIEFGTLKAFVAPDEEVVRPARASRHRRVLYHPRVTNCRAVNVDIPEGVDTIGEGAFERCFALSSITFPETLEVIGMRAFCWCNNLKEIRLPSKLKKLRKEAFANCIGLTKIVIPDSVEVIGESAFAGCRKLQEIYLPDALCGKAASIFAADEAQIYGAVCCGKLKVNPAFSLSLENSMKQRWDEAMEKLITAGNCAMMKRYLALWKDEPAAVEKLDKAIERSVRLEKTDMTALLIEYKNRYYSAERQGEMLQSELERALGKTTVAEWREVFSYRDEEHGRVITRYKGDDTLIEVPAQIGRKPVIAVAGWNLNAEHDLEQPYEIILPEGLQEIRAHAFRNCRNLTDIVLPSTVTEIGASAFEGCASLEEVVIPEGVSCIREETFSNCSALCSVGIPESVTEIQWDAFCGCESLREVVLPPHVTRINVSRCREGKFPITAAVAAKGSVTEQTIRDTPIRCRVV